MLKDAVNYRDGLMIALLAFAPLRRKNVASIAIGRELVKEGDTWSIIFPRESSKTGAPIDFAIPEFLRPYLETYLNAVRLRLSKCPTSKALWASRKGGAVSYSAIWFILTRHSERRLRIRISPHDVRDAGATTWAIARPAQIGVARDLLAQADLRTTTKYYNRARGVEASRAHAAVIAALRKKHRR
jgi:integrase/recombinase XerD